MHLTQSASRIIGNWDNGGRFFLKEEFETPTSRLIRTPSRAYPYSVYKHIFTAKYFKSLTPEQLEKVKNHIEA